MTEFIGYYILSIKIYLYYNKLLRKYQNHIHSLFKRKKKKTTNLGCLLLITMD